MNCIWPPLPFHCIHCRTLWSFCWHLQSKVLNSCLFSLTLEGKRHDAGMLADSKLLDQLERNAFSTASRPLRLGGDLAFPLRVHLQGPYEHAVLTPLQEAFNTSMSGVRESVEWLFRDIVEYLKVIDFKKNLKIQLSSVGKYYTVCAIFRNALTYLYGTQHFLIWSLQLYKNTFLNFCHHFNPSKTKGWVICFCKQGGFHNTFFSPFAHTY